MSQAFFSLSLGIGSMTIFGSYLSKDRALMGESIYVIFFGALSALMSGLVIFPACFAFGVDAGAGPGLIFVTLPNVFNSMVGGRLWGTLFFIFLSFASLTTVIAVFEHLIAFAMDEWKWSRKKASYVASWSCSSPHCLASWDSGLGADFTHLAAIRAYLIWRTSLSVSTCFRWGPSYCIVLHT